MNKSISSFVLGLIFSIIGGITSYIFWLILALISAFATGILQIVVTICPLVNMATFVLSFLGCFFCLGKAKAGGIIMLIASILSLTSIFAVFIVIGTFKVVMLLFLLPTLIIFHVAIAAIKKKKIQNNDNQFSFIKPEIMSKKLPRF